MCRDSLLGSEPPVSSHLKKEAVSHDGARVGVGPRSLFEAAQGQCRDAAESETLEPEMRIYMFTLDFIKGLSLILLDGLQAFQVIWKLLDTCSGTAADLEKEGFEKDIFRQLRESSADYRYDLVSQ